MSISPTSYPKYLYLITFAYAFATFASGIFMPIYAFFVQELGGGILETSWAVALYSIITGLGAILIHRTAVSHRYPLTFLWVGWLLWLLSMALYLITQTFAMLYVSQILNGIGDALCQPIYDAEFSKKVAADPSQGWALFSGTTSIFSGIAALAGGAVATWYGFGALLYCVIAIGTASFLMIVYYIYAEQKERN